MSPPLHSREPPGAPLLRQSFDDTVATLAALARASAWVVSGAEVQVLRAASEGRQPADLASEATARASEPPSNAAIVAAAAAACESGLTTHSGALVAVPWVFVRRAGAYVLTTVPEDAVRFIERTIARATDFARAESVLDAMGEGVLLADANGVITVATVRAGALLQTTPAALEGQPLTSVIPAIHALEPGEIVRGSLRDKGLHFTVHHQAPATQPDPTPDAAPGLLVRLRSDERFAPTRQRQMQLLSILRHDVRSPLTSVRGLVSVLLDEPDMPREERLGLLDLLRQEAERTVTWVEDYLVVLRLRLDPRPQHMVACELGGWMETLERVFARHAEERHITLRMERPPPKRFEVQAEPALLESFGKNLVGHAFRLADAGATIDVRVVPEDGSFEVRARGPGLFGVPPRQPFTTLARSTAAGKRTPGVGLGLFLAKKIADAHGWRIEARQELENGLSLHTRWG